MITPFCAHTGAEVRDIDPTRPIDEPDRVQLYVACVEH
jgi:hypothetical protein